MTRRRTIWVAALVALVVLVVLGVVAVAMLPELVRRAAIWRLEALTQRRVSIDRVDVSVLTGQVVVHNLRVDDRDEPVPLARVERITGRLHRRSLLELHVWIDDLAIERSSVHIVRVARNRFNISDLLDRPRQPPGPVGVTIDRLRIVDGTVLLEDRTLRLARTWKSEHIAIEARHVSTRGRDGSGVGSTIVAGAPVHVRVEDLGLTPVHVRAHVTVGNVDLALLRLYLPGDALVLPERGTLAAGITVVHDAADGTRISAGARIRALALEHAKQSGPLLTSPETLVTLNELHVKDGGFELARAEIEGDVELTEALVGPPVTYAFTRTRLLAEDLAWPGSRPGRVAFSSRLPDGGSVEVRGTFQAQPMRVDARVKVAGADLRHVNRYATLAGIVSGVGDVDARVVGTWERALRLSVTGSIAGSRLALVDPGSPSSSPPPLTVERLDISALDYQWPARVSVGAVRVRRPSVTVERDAAGALTLPRLLTRAAPPDAEGGGGAETRVTPQVRVGEVRVDGGTVVLVDGTLKPPPRLALTDVALGLRDLSWPASGIARVELAAGLPGGGLATGNGTIDLDGRRTRTKLTLKNVDLAQAQPFLPFRGRVSGRAEGELDVRGGLDPFRLRVRGDVAVTEAGVEDLDRPLLAVEHIAIAGLDYRWPLRVAVEQLSVRRPWAKIDRNERGELTLRAAFLARRPPGTGTPAREAGAPPKPEIVVRRVLVEEGGTSIIDDSVEPAARFEVRGTRVEARNITYPVTIPAEVTLATPTPGGGRVEGRGTFQLEPGRADLRATLSGVALGPAQPYLPFAARVTGTVDGDVRISARFDPLALTVRGNAAVGKLAVGDEHRSLLTADQARAQGVTVEWPGRVRVERMDIDRPWLLLERDDRGHLPLVALLTPSARGGRSTGGSARREPAPPPRVEVGALNVNDGFGRFVDRVPSPAFAEELSALQLTVVGLDTAPGTLARASVRATMGPSSPVAISGEFSPPAGPRRLDVLLTIGEYPAPRANPYLQTLFGWTARQGRITLAAHYTIDGDALDATNDVGASGLVLERASVADAPRWPIGLPLGTFVALLKNREGNLELSVPIHGTLSSPTFELGNAIAGALRGIAVRTVTLPFSLVGRVLVNEQERVEALQVDPVLFDPGTPTPSAGMPEHIDRLAQFLRERPAVHMRVRPVLSIEDVTRLKRVALRERVRAEAGERTPTAMRDALAQLYAERFPRRAAAAVDEMVAALAEHDPAPTEASRALAERRVQAVRDALAARGVDAQRLPVIDATPAVEAAGAGRVEFELVE